MNGKRQDRQYRGAISLFVNLWLVKSANRQTSICWASGSGTQKQASLRWSPSRMPWVLSLLTQQEQMLMHSLCQHKKHPPTRGNHDLLRRERGVTREPCHMSCQLQRPVTTTVVAQLEGQATDSACLLTARQEKYSAAVVHTMPQHDSHPSQGTMQHAMLFSFTCVYV
jgi:hypothetical protein